MVDFESPKGLCPLGLQSVSSVYINYDQGKQWYSTPEHCHTMDFVEKKYLMTPVNKKFDGLWLW